MIRKFLLGSLCVLSFASPAFADAANLLGVFGNWSAYSAGTGSSKTCYIMTQPRAVRPKHANRGDIYLMVSDWPGRKVKSEPEIVPGYPYRSNVPVSLEIGSARFVFFSRNDGDHGTAWLKSLRDNPGLISAMKKGATAVARGTSTHGTRTVDTYSLAGFTKALAKIHAACKM